MGVLSGMAENAEQSAVREELGLAPSGLSTHYLKHLHVRPTKSKSAKILHLISFSQTSLESFQNRVSLLAGAILKAMNIIFGGSLGYQSDSQLLGSIPKAPCKINPL